MIFRNIVLLKGRNKSIYIKVNDHFSVDFKSDNLNEPPMAQGTSVLIDFLSGKENHKVSLFDKILENKIPFGINAFIFQEVLQGARDFKEYENLKEYLESLPFYYLKNGKDSYEQAAFLNFTCRKNGKTIRSTINLIIAQTAIEIDLWLLHKDDDYDQMASFIKNLKIYNGNFI